MNYPVYKKAIGLSTFHKINSDVQAVTVILLLSITKIRVVENRDIVEDILGENGLIDCTREKFEKAYTEALRKLTEANNIQ